MKLNSTVPQQKYPTVFTHWWSVRIWWAVSLPTEAWRSLAGLVGTPAG
jgi:hypothetical protein